MMMMSIFVGLQFSPFGCCSLNGITSAIYNYYVLLCITVFCEVMAFNSFFIPFLLIKFSCKKKDGKLSWIRTVWHTDFPYYAHHSLIEGNGEEAWQSFLVCFYLLFGGLALHKTW